MGFSAFPHVPFVPFWAPVDWLAPGGPMGVGNPTISGETETQVWAGRPWQPHIVMGVNTEVISEALL